MYVHQYSEPFKVIEQRKKSHPQWTCPPGYSQEFMNSKVSVRGNTIQYGSGPGLVPTGTGGICKQNCPPNFAPERFPYGAPMDKCWFDCTSVPGYFNNGHQCRKFAHKNLKTGKITKGHSFPRPFKHRYYKFVTPKCSDGYNRSTLHTVPKYFERHNLQDGTYRSFNGDSICASKCRSGFYGLRGGCLQK
jgi:hypothetical protein